MGYPWHGMGAIPHWGGTTFRVWAPHASYVSVMGSFNGWSGDAHPLQPEGDGYWVTDIDGVDAGDEYKYVLRNGARTFDRIDPYARRVTNSVGNGVVYDPDAFDWQGDAYTLPSFNELVIYELHVGSYNTGDGTPFEQIQKKLGHFQHLGVNVIQLMPVMEFAGDFSWGYNPAHLFAVESSYGGPDGLKTLIREAHKAGIGVILDVVYNHFGPSDLATWQFDGWGEPDKGGIYFYNDYRSATPWGDTRPDYGRPEVRAFIRDNAFQWLRDFHADGLRYDMTPYIRSVDGGETDLPDGFDLLHRLNSDIRAEFGSKILIAEDLHGDPTITDPGGAGFHAQWDAHFIHPVRDATLEMYDEDRSMPEVIEAITHQVSPDRFARVIYTESHDDVANGRQRIPQEIDEFDPKGWFAQKRSTLAAALAFTSPGIPMLFQGQEFMQGEYFRDDVPLDWHLNDAFQGIVRLYRDLIKWRRNVGNVTRGLEGEHVQIMHSNDDLNVIAFQRWMEGGPGDAVVVVVNLSNQYHPAYTLGFPTPGLWRLRLNSDASSYSPAFSNATAFDVTASGDGADGMAASATLILAPYTVQVYSQDR